MATKRKSAARRGKKKSEARIMPAWLRTILAVCIIAVFSAGFYWFFIRPYAYRWKPCYGQKGYGVCMPCDYEVHGIDISHYQGSIDWVQLTTNKTTKFPIHFVFMKATEGGDHADDTFPFNFDQAHRYGFIRGAYHFFSPKTDPLKQADFFIRTVQLIPRAHGGEKRHALGCCADGEVDFGFHGVNGVDYEIVLRKRELPGVLGQIKFCDRCHAAVGVDVADTLRHDVDLPSADGGVQGDQLAVDIGFRHGIGVDDGQRADPHAGERFADVAADPADPEHGDVRAVKFFHGGVPEQAGGAFFFFLTIHILIPRFFPAPV